MDDPNELTYEQALALFESDWWKPLTHRERAEFQLFTSRLCMPFTVFHEALEKALGRPVFTHELGLNYERLKAELRGERPAPTFAEILEMIPAEKRILVEV